MSMADAVALERDFELAKATIMATDAHKRSAIVQHSLSEAALHDAEALSLKLGALQQRIKHLQGQHITDVTRLESLQRTMFVPRSVHQMCHYARCKMVSFRRGDCFYSHRYRCELRATGDIYVCPVSGLSHRCGDGIACPHLVYTDGKENAICEISGRIYDASVSMLGAEGRHFSVTGDDGADGGGGGDGGSGALDYGESAPTGDPDDNDFAVATSTTNKSAMAITTIPAFDTTLSQDTTARRNDRLLEALLEASEQRYNTLEVTTAAAAAATDTEDDDNNIGIDDERLQHFHPHQDRDAPTAKRINNNNTSRSRKRRASSSSVVAATNHLQRQQGSGSGDNNTNTTPSTTLNRAVYAHMLRAVDMLIYGHTTRDALVERVIEFRRHFHSKMLGRYALTGAVVAPDASASEAVSNAWLIGKALRHYRDAMGSSEMEQQVARRLGYVPNAVALNEQQLRTVLQRQWVARLPNVARRVAIVEYFSMAVMTACRLLTAMPAYSSACQVKKVAIAVLCLLRDGVCYDVLYDERTGLLVEGFRTPSSTRRRVCARLKNCGFGMRDSPAIDQPDIVEAVCGTLDDDDDDDAADADGQPFELSDSTRCREVWLLPSHAFLQNLPANEIIGRTNLPGKLVSKMMHARREVSAVHSSIFDPSRNTALATTMTIDELERRFCLHQHFAVRRATGLVPSTAIPSVVTSSGGGNGIETSSV